MTGSGGGAPSAGDPFRGLRRALLALFALGAAGLLAELYLLEHFEEWEQWLPFTALVPALPVAAWVAFRPGPLAVRALRLLGAVMAAMGLLGLGFHFAGNRAFELELAPDLSGWPLLVDALRGATPVLAPGALVQLGLLGLAATWRHPATGSAPGGPQPASSAPDDPGSMPS